MMVALFQITQNLENMGRNQHQVSVECLARHRNDRVRNDYLAGHLPTAITDIALRIFRRPDDYRPVPKEKRGFHKAGQCPFFHYGVVVQPQVEVLAVLSRSFPRETHSLVPEQISLGTYHMGLWEHFGNSISCAVSTPVIYHVHGK